jgi:hypothetical protein
MASIEWNSLTPLLQMSLVPKNRIALTIVLVGCSHFVNNYREMGPNILAKLEGREGKGVHF